MNTPLAADSLMNLASQVKSWLSCPSFLCLVVCYKLKIRWLIKKISFVHFESALNLENLSNALVCTLGIFSLPRLSPPPGQDHHSSACSLGLGRGKLNNKWPLSLCQSSHSRNIGYWQDQKVGDIGWALTATSQKGTLALTQRGLVGFMAGGMAAFHLARMG